MKKRLLKALGVAVLMALCSGTSFSQIIFQEDFDGVGGPTAGGAGTYMFPPGWLLRNVDNRTPNAQTAYVNDAWERREDFKFNVADSAMFGNSWYAPVGPANDWAWTPLIGPLPANAVLRWNAVSYDPLFLESYEVRVMVAPTAPTGGTGVIGNQITNSTVIFSTTAAPATWTAQSASLSAYAGQSIYIGFRNISNDMFIQLIDDVLVEVLTNYDGLVQNAARLSEYTRIPKTQVQPLALAADIRNNGALPLTNVALNVEVRNSANAVVHTATSPAVTVNAGAQSTFTIPSWTPPSVAEVYTIKLFSTCTEADQNNANDTLTRTFVIADQEYARNTNTVTGSLGIGAGNGGYLGQDFLVVNADRIDSIGMFVNQGYIGRRMAIAVWNMAAGEPNQIIRTTDTLIYPSNAAAYYLLPMHGGPLNLAPGRYAVTAIEFDSTLAVGLTDEIFTTGRTWVDWPTSPITGWANNEDFTGNFQKAYVINPHFIGACPPSLIDAGATVVADAACGIADGSVTLAVQPAGNYTYQWSNGQTTATVNGLAAGTYTVTVTNTDLVCTQTQAYTINNVNGPVLSSITADDALCNGGNGSAEVQVSGGTPGYTYLWSNGATSATISAAAGTYTVAVTDNNGCILNAGPVTIAEPTQLTGTTAATDETCAGCNDGTATATAAGGTAPYTYAWSPAGGTGATAAGLAPGAYTVTITDANGCTATSTVTVGAASGLDETAGNKELSVYPNPSNGHFYITSDIDYSGAVTVEVVDINGKLVSASNHVINNSFTNTSIQINGLAPGNYMLRFIAGEKVFLRKLVIK